MAQVSPRTGYINASGYSCQCGLCLGEVPSGTVGLAGLSGSELPTLSTVKSVDNSASGSGQAPSQMHPNVQDSLTQALLANSRECIVCFDSNGFVFASSCRFEEVFGTPRHIMQVLSEKSRRELGSLLGVSPRKSSSLNIRPSVSAPESKSPKPTKKSQAQNAADKKEKDDGLGQFGLVNVEMVSITTTGVSLPVQVRLQRLSSKDKGQKAFLMAVHDLKERHRAALSEGLDSVARAKGLFLAKMSHEIRTPVHGILGMAQLLAGERSLTSNQSEYVQLILQSADALLHVINDILDFSKVEQGKIELETLSFNLTDVVEDAVELCKTAAFQKNLDLNTYVSRDIPQSVLGDSGRLRQVLLNLVWNAIKFTEEGHVDVVVTLESEDEDFITVKTAVSDTGIGIEPSDSIRIFQAFEQTGGKIHRGAGAGLGLAISKQLVTLMNGRIWAVSQVGRGSSFFFNVKFKRDDQRSGQFPFHQPKHGVYHSANFPPHVHIHSPLTSPSDANADVNGNGSKNQNARTSPQTQKKAKASFTLSVPSEASSSSSPSTSTSTKNTIKIKPKPKSKTQSKASAYMNMKINSDSDVDMDMNMEDSGYSGDFKDRDTERDKEKEKDLESHEHHHNCAVIAIHPHIEALSVLKKHLIDYGVPHAFADSPDVAAMKAAFSELEPPLQSKCRSIVVIGSKSVFTAATVTMSYAAFREVVSTEVAQGAKTFLIMLQRQLNPKTVNPNVDSILSLPYRGAKLFDTLSDVLYRGQGNIQAMTVQEPSKPKWNSFKDLPATMRVLVAEDNPTNMVVCTRMLKKMGIKYDTASNGEEAVKCYENALSSGSMYDLILMDCKMPVMDGIHASRIIRSKEDEDAENDAVDSHNNNLDRNRNRDQYRIPIIAVTASVMRGDREHCISVGMSDFLSKPYKLSELHDILRKWMPEEQLQVEEGLQKQLSASQRHSSMTFRHVRPRSHTASDSAQSDQEHPSLATPSPPVHPQSTGPAYHSMGALSLSQLPTVKPKSPMSLTLNMNDNPSNNQNDDSNADGNGNAILTLNDSLGDGPREVSAQALAKGSPVNAHLTFEEPQFDDIGVSTMLHGLDMKLDQGSQARPGFGCDSDADSSLTSNVGSGFEYGFIEGKQPAKSPDLFGVRVDVDYQKNQSVHQHSQQLQQQLHHDIEPIFGREVHSVTQTSLKLDMPHESTSVLLDEGVGVGMGNFNLAFGMGVSESNVSDEIEVRSEPITPIRDADAHRHVAEFADDTKLQMETTLQTKNFAEMINALRIGETCEDELEALQDTFGHELVSEQATRINSFGEGF